jgi:hypothetical protein
MCRKISSAAATPANPPTTIRHDLSAPALGRLLFGRQQPSASPGQTTVTIPRIRDVEAPLAIGHG